MQVIGFANRVISQVFKLQPVVVKSITKAKCIIFTQASKEVVWTPTLHTKSKNIFEWPSGKHKYIEANKIERMTWKCD